MENPKENKSDWRICYKFSKFLFILDTVSFCIKVLLFLLNYSFSEKRCRSSFRTFLFPVKNRFGFSAHKTQAPASMPGGGAAAVQDLRLGFGAKSVGYHREKHDWIKKDTTDSADDKPNQRPLADRFCFSRVPVLPDAVEDQADQRHKERKNVKAGRRLVRVVIKGLLI